MKAFMRDYKKNIYVKVLLATLISGLIAVSSMAVAAPPPGDGYRLTVFYVIPSNRSEQPNARVQLQDYVLRMRAWYGEEMARLGYGNKSFIYETDPNDLTSLKPKINVVLARHTDSYFQGNIWGETLASVAEYLGADPAIWPWQSNNPAGELVLVVVETQILRFGGMVDGAFVGGTEGGAGWPFRGVAVVSGDDLARFSASLLTDNRLYDGLLADNTLYYGLSVPLGLNPPPLLPLIQDVTFPWWEGTTVSSISSSAQGAALHELSHGLGLWHECQNDANFNGNLMCNGLRGIRGSLNPTLYPNDDTRLSKGAARLLNYNRFFNTTNTQKDFTGDNNPPYVTITTQNVTVPVNGQCPVTFSASDMDSTLAGALLIRDGEVVAEMPLTGNNVSTTLATYDYVPGQSYNWLIQVFDTQGNLGFSPDVSITCATGYNRAPQPYIKISKRLLNINESVILDAGQSLDPDGRTTRMAVQWDLNGDGIYDTPFSRTKTYTTTYGIPGVYQIVARLRDERNSMSKSVPIGIRVQ
jgi:hypothetical protein